jgi:ribosome-binding protein aMBF1 (putative translation factor)
MLTRKRSECRPQKHTRDAKVKEDAPRRMAGDEFRAMRLALGWTRAQLADELCRSTEQIARYERGERTIPLKVSAFARLIVEVEALKSPLAHIS